MNNTQSIIIVLVTTTLLAIGYYAGHQAATMPVDNMTCTFDIPRIDIEGMK